MPRMYHEPTNQPSTWGAYFYVPDEVLNFMKLKYSSEGGRDCYGLTYPGCPNVFVVGHNIIQEVIEFARTVDVEVIEVDVVHRQPQAFEETVRRMLK